MHTSHTTEPFLPCAGRLRAGDVIVGLDQADHELTLPATVQDAAQGPHGWVVVHLQAHAPAHDIVTVLAANQVVELQPPF